ncbi:hypothetical protein [Gilliamella sp. wkB178]|uniref:hypothetical protein n=1 Tax=Gilliamella sp. wkB178 TaxID=3120259 RepID=UPI00159EC29E|nr:hypothetical protein [Gilliamella apicola]
MTAVKFTNVKVIITINKRYKIFGCAVDITNKIKKYNIAYWLAKKPLPIVQKHVTTD